MNGSLGSRFGRYVLSGGLACLLVVALSLGSFVGIATSARADNLSPDELYGKLSSAQQVRQLSGGKTLYIMYDPQCPACKSMFHRLMDVKDEAQDAGVSIGWVPVSIINRLSNPQGQTHLKQGFGELKSHFQGDESEPSDDDRLKQAIEANTELMSQSSEATGTPALVFRTRKGVRVITGVPSTDYLKKIFKHIR